MSVDLQNATTSSTSLNFEVKSLDQNQSVSFTAYTGTADLLIRKDLLTTPNGIGLNADGIAYDDGTTITSTSWDVITDRIAYLSAIAPNNLNPTILAVNDTISIQNANSAPTKVINTSAGDPASSGHFGTAWVGGGIPYIMETLDSTALQIKDTILVLEDTGTPQTTDITATSISIVGGNSATWANIINNVGGGIPSLSQVLSVGQSAGNQNISDLNGLTYQGGTSLFNNSLAFTGSAGAITDLATINGSPYPPTFSQNLNTTLSYGNNTSGFDIDFNSNSSILNVVNINGSPYPPYPVTPYGLTDTLNYSNNASGLSMTNINNIDLVSINGNSYPPTIPSGNYYMPFQNYFVSNNSPPQAFSIGITIEGGFNYGITWTMYFDGLYQIGGQNEMITAYSGLYSIMGAISGTGQQSGVWASSYVSTNNMYRTCITYTDYYSVVATDTYYPYVYQLNTQGWNGIVYISAVITRVN